MNILQHDVLRKRTKISKALAEKYTIEGIVPHVSGCNVTGSLMRIVGPNVMVIAPKVLHQHFQEENTTVRLITPQMYAKHPEAADVILWLYGSKTYEATASVVLKLKK